MFQNFILKQRIFDTFSLKSTKDSSSIKWIFRCCVHASKSISSLRGWSYLMGYPDWSRVNGGYLCPHKKASVLLPYNENRHSVDRMQWFLLIAGWDILRKWDKLLPFCHLNVPSALWWFRRLRCQQPHNLAGYRSFCHDKRVHSHAGRVFTEKHIKISL